MPNWCSNELTISGDPEKVQEFVKALSGFGARYVEKDDIILPPREEFEFTFNTMVPVPPEVEQAGYSSVGYNWQIANWGTKWDVGNDFAKHERDNGSVEFSFSTAWSPPVEWVATASIKYPDVEIDLKFEEGGCHFYGAVTYVGGDCIQDYGGDDYEGYKEFCIEEMGYDKEYFDEMEEEWEDE